MLFANYKEMNISSKINVVLALTVLGAIAVAYFVILPTINNIKKLKADLITQKIELEEKMDQDKNMVELNANLKKIEPQLQTLEKIFINKNRELEFITMIESIEKKNLVTQKLIINTASPDNKSIIQTVPITIEVSGEYKNILQYLSDLEALPYYININHIDLNTGENQNAVQALDSEKTNGVRLSIGADTYWK